MRSLLLLPLLLLIGCASGHCVQAKKQAAPPPIEEPKMTTERVKVFKYDGSLQCGMGKPISPSDMQKELGAIKVYSAENKYDGLMHVQACGTITGKANVYEIDKKDLEAAQKAGFKLWTYDEVK